MSHYRKTDPTTAMTNLLKQALIVQRWAMNEGTPSQQNIADALIKAIVAIAPKMSPKPIYVPLVDNAAYEVNQQLNHPPNGRVDDQPTEQEIEQAFFAGVDATFTGSEGNNPFAVDTQPRLHQAFIDGVNSRSTTAS